MGFYNAMHGRNQLAPELLKLAGLLPEEIPRFRDAWLKEGKVVIFTRTGGGNDECDCDDTDESWRLHALDRSVKYEGKMHDSECYWMMNRKLEKKANFVLFRYDEYDSTYAYFTFNPVPGMEQLAALVEAAQSPRFDKSFKERSQETLEAIKKMKPEDLKAKYPAISQLMEELAKKLAQ